jgi:2Fe-2S ferredoxin
MDLSRDNVECRLSSAATARDIRSYHGAWGMAPASCRVYPYAMVEVTFIDAEGAQFPVQSPEGSSLMEAAIAHDVPSIVGFCGGMCACGTCHCYPAPDWVSRLTDVSENEADTLKRVLERRAVSRLACQIRLDDRLDGLVVHLPPRQRNP